MKVLDLPDDVIYLIIEHLQPEDLIRLRHVSQSFHHAFTNEELNRISLQRHFPKSCEARVSANGPSYMFWRDVFSRAAYRYHSLGAGLPASIMRYLMAHSFVLPAWSRSYQIAPWQRELHFESKRATFDYPDTAWTYDDGLLLFPCGHLRSYAVLDLQTRTLTSIDIESSNRITRRIRLKKKVLVVEWCEVDSYHQLNESETVYRHYATTYDVKRAKQADRWVAVFRNEWKIHFLGMPLNSQDRFFSMHNESHYAVYIWHPNRSAWGEDEPIESLTIWDISSPSSYRPSGDPTGKSKISSPDMGPRVIKRLISADLDFYSIRQRDTPRFRRLELDEQHVYFIEEDHRWMRGNQASSVPPRLHEVKCTGIPFHLGPRWEASCGIEGDRSMSFCQKSSNIRAPYLPPCWRHEEYPYLTIDEVIDREAGVAFSARQCFMLEALQISIQPRNDVEAQEVNLQDELWQELLAKGKIYGDERWLIGENNHKEVVIMYFDR